jgi:hypothetical protein
LEYEIYTLRFPFSLPPGQEIAVTEQTAEIDGLTCLLKKQDRFYVLTITGFPTEDSAKRYINNVWTGLMWMLLHHDLSPDAILEPQKVAYGEDPYQAAKNLSKSFGIHIDGPIDGLIDGARPAIYSTDKKLHSITGGQVAVTMSTPAEQVLKFIGTGAAFTESARVIDDAKLRVALELYGLYFTESSANTRFLTLVMALEAVATGVPRSQLVLRLLDKWKKEADEMQNGVESESDDSISLDALSRELFFRKEDSIRRQIRNLVSTTLQANGDTDASEMAKLAVRIYDLRSTLVHEGKLESRVLSKATSDAKNIVKRVLRARFVQKATSDGNENV